MLPSAAARIRTFLEIRHAVRRRSVPFDYPAALPCSMMQEIVVITAEFLQEFGDHNGEFLHSAAG